jgi:hypothetical protein
VLGPTVADLPRSLCDSIPQIQDDFGPLQVLTSGDGRVFFQTRLVSTALGWSPSESELMFIVPPGFPDQIPAGFYGRPDLFYSDRLPPNAKRRQIGRLRLTHFCWSPSTWSPAHDTLLSYVLVARERFRAVPEWI